MDSDDKSMYLSFRNVLNLVLPAFECWNKHSDERFRKEKILPLMFPNHWTGGLERLQIYSFQFPPKKILKFVIKTDDTSIWY